VKKLFQKILPVISFKIDPLNDIAIKFDWEETQKALDEIINLPEKIAIEKKIRIIICIDEFQNINQFSGDGRLEEILRAYWQHHQQVTYCLYGSKKHMMKEIFYSQSRPFFHFGDIIMLQKVPRENWIEFIINGFAKTNKKISEQIATEIIETADNHPEYVQQLAHFTWSSTELLADHDALVKAIELVLNSNRMFFQEICDNLSITQLNLLKALIHGETQFTSVEVMQKYKLGTPRNVFKNKESLEAKDIIDFSNNPPSFSDPFFKNWFQQVFCVMQ
jgi:AAA+ ATPase superfamily predicted ATPase